MSVRGMRQCLHSHPDTVHPSRRLGIDVSDAAGLTVTERRTLVQNVIQSKSADVLERMTWSQFEKLVGEASRLQGYSVTEADGSGADGGVDLVLIKGGEKFLVQCKQSKAFKVSVEVVRELYGVMAAKGATGGFIVTSGRFTDDASSFASESNVKLIDGPELYGLIQQAKASGSSDPASPTPPTVRQPVGLATTITSASRSRQGPAAEVTMGDAIQRWFARSTPGVARRRRFEMAESCAGRQTGAGVTIKVQ